MNINSNIIEDIIYDNNLIGMPNNENNRQYIASCIANTLYKLAYDFEYNICIDTKCDIDDCDKINIKIDINGVDNFKFIDKINKMKMLDKL
jgi:hypothetical protein